MQPKILSYNGFTTINDGTNFVASFPPGTVLLQADSTPVTIDRPHLAPIFVQKVKQSRTLPVEVEIKSGVIASQLDTLHKIFYTGDNSGAKTLVITDVVDGNRQWSVQATVIGMPNIDGPMVTFTLFIVDPIWQTVTQNSDAWAITTSGSTHSVAAIGTVPAYPILRIKPTSARTGGLPYKRLILVSNPTTYAYPNYPVELTNGGLDTATLVTGGKMQASGNDCLIYVDGSQANRWLGTGANAINTTQTFVYAVISISPRQQPTLKSAISTSDTITSLAFTNDTTNAAAVTAIPIPGMLLIDSEVFTYTGKDTVNKKVTGVTRAAKLTAAASHTTGATIKWIEHEVWMYYGDSTLGAPVVDDTQKPIFALTSTNGVWTYTGGNFFSSGGKRAGEWKPAVISSLPNPSIRNTEYYSATQHAFADPATAMGLSIMSYPYGTAFRSDTARLELRLNQPAGVTTAVFNGSKYRVGSLWPVTMALQKSVDGVYWSNVWNQATPTTAANWTAYTGSPTGLSGTYRWLRLFSYGSCSATSTSECSIEATTVQLTIANPPTVSLGAENANYDLNATITNTTTGEAINVRMLMEINQSLEIDCAAHKVTYLKDNSNAYAALTMPIRNDWMTLAVGANVLQFDDAGTGNVQITTLWNDRGS